MKNELISKFILELNMSLSNSSGVEQVFNGEIAKRWDEKAKYVTYYGIKNPIKSEIMSSIHDGISVADIGCGAGKIIQRIDKNVSDCKLTGLDISHDMISVEEQKQFIDTYIRHIYCSYSILCSFNNLLTSCYDVEKDYLNSNSFIEEYLLNNEDVKESKDSHCRSIYENIKIWNNRLKNNYTSLDDIKWQVAKTMKFYEKKGIFKISGINLKRNNYDFVV